MASLYSFRLTLRAVAVTGVRCPALLPGPTRSCKRNSPDGHPEPDMEWSDGGGQPRLFGHGVYVFADVT